MSNMYEVQCGIKLSHWNKGQVFGSPNKFKTIKEAKKEADILLNTCVKEMFNEVEYGKLIEIDENLTAWYENNPKYFLKARMDGKILDEDNEGEFYIEIVEKNLSIN